MKFDIPIIIFEDEKIDTEDKIKTILDNNFQTSMFEQEKRILDKLTKNGAVWYFYSYRSHISKENETVWKTKTTFFKDYSVIDEHNNKGQLFIGKNQSIIIKESKNSKNLTSITFDNQKVSYGIIPFSRVSKTNSLSKEMFNFGFF